MEWEEGKSSSPSLSQGSERGAAAGVEWGKGVFAQVKADGGPKGRKRG